MITLTAKINVLEENNSFNKSLSVAKVGSYDGDFANVLGTKLATKPYRGKSFSDENGDLGTIQNITSEFSTIGLFGGKGIPRFGGQVGDEFLVTYSAETRICGAKLSASYTVKEISIENNGVRIASIPAQKNDLFRFEAMGISATADGTLDFNGYFYVPMEYTQTHELDEVFELLKSADFSITVIEKKSELQPYYEFTIVTNQNADHLIFAFADGLHPQYVEINGQDFYCSNNTLIVPTSGTTHNVVIKKMARPNTYLAINGIYTGVTINVDRRNITSIDLTVFDRGDVKMPSFGIISNAGRISYIDSNEETLELAEKNLLQEGKKCEIYLSNTLVLGKTEKVGDMETEQWDYDVENKTVSVSIKDDLEEWQEINVDAIDYNPKTTIYKPFKWLYEHLWAITKTNYDMLSFDELDDDTKAVLENTYTKYPLLEKGTLWQQWTKLCEVCQLHIYKDKNGKVVCHYNGGN